MSDIQEYKCFACGGAMEFNSAKQKMVCPYCGTELTVDEYEKQYNEAHKQEEECKNESDNVNMSKEKSDEVSYNDKNEENTLDSNKDKGGSYGQQKASIDADKDLWTSSGNSKWEDGETDGMKVYVCESCGGEIIADDTTGASICPYCGNKVVMKHQFKGDLKPDYIIPFKYDRKAAKKAYLEHLKDKAFLPRVFKSENHIDELKGVYVPFWLFDIDAKADILYKAEKTRVWTSGKTEYTEHKFYEVHRGGDICFDHIPEDGAQKMDDTLMESVEPFDFKDAVPFKKAYMAGYVADRYDVKAEERINRAKERVSKSAEEEFRKTISGYDMVTTKNNNVDILKANYSYALYPVWILNTTWHDKKYVFAMNGQTGKLVGDLPVDKGLFWKFVGLWGSLSGIILFIIMYIIKLF